MLTQGGNNITFPLKFSKKSIKYPNTKKKQPEFPPFHKQILQISTQTAIWEEFCFVPESNSIYSFFANLVRSTHKHVKLVIFILCRNYLNGLKNSRQTIKGGIWTAHMTLPNEFSVFVAMFLKGILHYSLRDYKPRPDPSALTRVKTPVQKTADFFLSLPCVVLWLLSKPHRSTEEAKTTKQLMFTAQVMA